MQFRHVLYNLTVTLSVITIVEHIWVLQAFVLLHFFLLSIFSCKRKSNAF